MSSRATPIRPRKLDEDGPRRVIANVRSREADVEEQDDRGDDRPPDRGVAQAAHLLALLWWKSEAVARPDQALQLYGGVRFCHEAGERAGVIARRNDEAGAVLERDFGKGPFQRGRERDRN